MVNTDGLRIVYCGSSIDGSAIDDCRFGGHAMQIGPLSIDDSSIGIRQSTIRQSSIINRQSVNRQSAIDDPQWT
jgi:hypothetical protein